MKESGLRKRIEDPARAEEPAYLRNEAMDREWRAKMRQGGGALPGFIRHELREAKIIEKVADIKDWIAGVPTYEELLERRNQLEKERMKFARESDRLDRIFRKTGIDDPARAEAERGLEISHQLFMIVQGEIDKRDLEPKE